MSDELMKALQAGKDKYGNVPVAHTYRWGHTEYRVFETPEEAQAWITKSIYDHIEKDMVVGDVLPTNVCGVTSFKILKTLVDPTKSELRYCHGSKDHN